MRNNSTLPCILVKLPCTLTGPKQCCQPIMNERVRLDSMLMQLLTVEKIRAESSPEFKLNSESYKFQNSRRKLSYTRKGIWITCLNFFNLFFIENYCTVVTKKSSHLHVENHPGCLPSAAHDRSGQIYWCLLVLENTLLSSLYPYAVQFLYVSCVFILLNAHKKFIRKVIQGSVIETFGVAGWDIGCLLDVLVSYLLICAPNPAYFSEVTKIIKTGYSINLWEMLKCFEHLCEILSY